MARVSKLPDCDLPFLRSSDVAVQYLEFPASETLSTMRSCIGSGYSTQDPHVANGNGSCWCDTNFHCPPRQCKLGLVCTYLYHNDADDRSVVVGFRLGLSK